LEGNREKKKIDEEKDRRVEAVSGKNEKIDNKS